MAKYTALILVSSLPLSVEVIADAEKKQNAVNSLSMAEKKSSTIKRKGLAQNNRKIIDETRGFVSGTQQALTALEKNDSKAAFAILQDISEKLAVILDEKPALASVTAEMEAEVLYFKGDANADNNGV